MRRGITPSPDSASLVLTMPSRALLQPLRPTWSCLELSASSPTPNGVMMRHVCTLNHLSPQDLTAGRHNLIWRISPGISSSFQSVWKRSRHLLEMVANLLSNGLLFVQFFAALALGTPTSSPLYKDPHAPVERRVKDLLSRMTIEDKRSQLTQGIVLSSSPPWGVSNCWLILVQVIWGNGWMKPQERSTTPAW